MQRSKLIAALGIMTLSAAPIYALADDGSSSSGPKAAECSNFPDRPLTYLIAFNAGGESDRTARAQQGPLKKILGQPIHITYKPGGGGALAWSSINDIQPDGYTLVGYNMPHIVLQPLVRGEAAGYKTSDLKQVYMFQLTPYILTTGPGSGIHSFEELIEKAKTEKVTIGGVGEDSGPYLVYLQLKKAFPDLNFTYVPYTGTGALTPAIIGGHVQVGVSNTPAVVTNPENIHGLAVASAEPMPQLPDTPTLKSLGVDIVEGAHRGVAVPKNTPDCRVDRLAQAIHQVNTDEKFSKDMEEQGFVLVNYGPEKATQFIQEKKAAYSEILEELGAS